ncbi:DUF4837 family protein [Mesohalobacter halotolerans]|uniref:DUF4837 family protein n=1 Tax=Mesohalobacter halotolerans TaxID=1883405 RepID=A0A4U5TTK7_9FLAO|nr:DUF4837 family protein [Mesohalobacter halotolerans]MBS3737915.1 DUF4837 family protein [Psychroflexus sp.]TKS57556.1 DUF4837 family protein [Mesohalobacter halotolerans]
MKRLLFLMALILMACDEGKSVYIADSSGNLNMVNIISENQLWDSKLGEDIRDLMAKDAEGLPQKEPLYKLRHIPNKAFTGFAKKNRTFLKFDLGKENKITFAKDSFARPQLGIFIKGRNEDELIKTFKDNQNKILNAINNTEISEKWRRMNKSLEDDTKIKNLLGISLKFPTAYRFAKESNDSFIWLRKEIKKGSMEIFIYEVPVTKIENENSVVSNIVKIRDSIGKSNVPGPRPGTYMITEEAYMPYLYETKIDGKFAYETRGTWVVKGAFMGGPFLNFAIKDEVNNRYVVLEGIVFKPTAEKRNNVFEIEAIGRSAKFID